MASIDCSCGSACCAQLLYWTVFGYLFLVIYFGVLNDQDKNPTALIDIVGIILPVRSTVVHGCLLLIAAGYRIAREKRSTCYMIGLVVFMVTHWLVVGILCVGLQYAAFAPGPLLGSHPWWALCDTTRRMWQFLSQEYRAIIELGYIAFSFSRTASRLKRQPDEAKRNVLNRTSCIILSAFRITCFWLIIDIASFRGESHMESRWNRWFLRSVQHGT